MLIVFTFLNTRGSRNVKNVGCGKTRVSRSRELIINSVVFLDSVDSNFVPTFFNVLSTTTAAGAGPPVSTGGFLPGTFNKDSSEMYPSSVSLDEDDVTDELSLSYAA